jgi:hypothetical protein
MHREATERLSPGRRSKQQAAADEGSRGRGGELGEGQIYYLLLCRAESGLGQSEAPIANPLFASLFCLSPPPTLPLRLPLTTYRLFDCVPGWVSLPGVCVVLRLFVSCRKRSPRRPTTDQPQSSRPCPPWANSISPPPGCDSWL